MKTLGLTEALEIALGRQRQSGAAIVHLVACSKPDLADLSWKLVISAAGQVAGELPDSIQVAATRAANIALDQRRSRVFSIAANANGGEILGMQGGDVDIFVEVLPSALELVIVGAGHIAQPLAAVGGLLGFQVTVIDDRPEFANRDRFPDAYAILATDFIDGLRSLSISSSTFVVLVTRGHTHDAASLRFVLPLETAYIGMIGSKMRIRTVLNQLASEGFTIEQLNRVYAPIGIDIGSHTPAEIAVAIAAEIISVQRGGPAPHLKLEYQHAS